MKDKYTKKTIIGGQKNISKRKKSACLPSEVTVWAIKGQYEIKLNVTQLYM